MGKTKSAIRVKELYKIAIISCEPSGDLIAAKLLKQLQQKISCDAQGIGGAQMLKTGFKTIFSIKELSVMGFWEIFFKIPKILFRLMQTVIWIRSYKPDILITVDAPSFNSRLVSLLRKFTKITFPIVQYVAPTVWAYNPQRAKKFADLYDHIFTILPFEKKYFDEVKLPCTYVGHPVLEDENITLNKADLKEKYSFNPDRKLVTITLGSREQEINYHASTIMDAMKTLIKQHPNIHFIFPTLLHLLPICKAIINAYQLEDYVTFVTDEKAKKELMYISDLALIKSGTIAIEAALLKVPMIIFYKVSKFTAFLIKRKIKIKYVSILNLIADKMIIPELLQDEFTQENLVKEANHLLGIEGEKQVVQLEKIILELHSTAQETPSNIASKGILRMLQR